VCLFTAGGGKRKGLSELLETFASIPDHRIKLLIVGRTDAPRLRSAIDHHNLNGRVFYAGYQQKIERYYGAAECLVFPSKYDAAANVVCEALACGLTVVTTATNGSSELIREGITGYVIPRADAFEKLKSAITRLAAGNNHGEMRAAAIETGMRYSMEEHIEQFEAVIQAYLEGMETELNPAKKPLP
jgi:glycosyltransferase involved in cell wall biosynthesis